MPTQNRASIRDVATRAGVSSTTVSHVLNDVGSARISEGTKVRVRRAAEQLGYRPSRVARGLRMRQNHTIGLISDDIATTPYGVGMILGAQETARALGWTVLIANTGSDVQAEQRAIHEILDHGSDGVLYASMYHRRVEIPPALRGVPVVLLDAECDDHDVASVVPDEYGGAVAAVTHLLQHGHRRIAFINNDEDVPATHERLRGYLHALTETGIAADPRLITAGYSDAHGGYAAVKKLFADNQGPLQPTAVFAFSDRMSMGIYRFSAETGLRIPTDLSIVGFDNQRDIADALHPMLTTVALPHYEMGAWAVRQLVGQVNQPDAQPESQDPTLMPCPLIERDSVTTLS